VVPPTGKVLVRANAAVHIITSGPLEFNLRDASGDVPGTRRTMTTSAAISRPTYMQKVAGLTPGNSDINKLGYRVSGTIAYGITDVGRRGSRSRLRDPVGSSRAAPP
jgi:hypothetical protein